MSDEIEKNIGDSIGRSVEATAAPRRYEFMAGIQEVDKTVAAMNAAVQAAAQHIDLPVRSMVERELVAPTPAPKPDTSNVVQMTDYKPSVEQPLLTREDIDRDARILEAQKLRDDALVQNYNEILETTHERAQEAA